MLFPVCIKLLHNDVLFAVTCAKQVTGNATVDHREIMDASAQQRLVVESGPKRVQWERMERKLSNVLQVF